MESFGNATTQQSSDNATTQQGVTSFVQQGQFDALSNKQKSDNKLLLTIMVAVVIFVVVTFWIELYSMHMNYQIDKTSMLQNNQLNKDYFDKVLLINNEVNGLKLNLEVLKAKNSYLKQ